MARGNIYKWGIDLQTGWIKSQITNEAILWAQEFGHYLADGTQRDEEKNPIQKYRNGEPEFDKYKNPKYETQTALSPSQLRKFFGEIRRIQATLQTDAEFDKTDLLLLKPKLAYQVGREKDKNAKIKDLYMQLSKGIDSVDNAKDFKRFVKLVEAVVAYHKEKEEVKS